jgi:hypothetical protein
MKPAEQQEVVVKPPSPQAWKLACQFIVSSILPRMIRSETNRENDTEK